MTDDEFSALNYFKEVDSALEKLSNKIEPGIASLPSVLLTTRKIELAYWQDEVAVRVTPDSSQDSDSISSYTMTNYSDFVEFHGPYWMLKQRVRASGDNRFFFSGDYLIDDPSDYMALPIYRSEHMLAFGLQNQLTDALSIKGAKYYALNYWNIGKQRLGQEHRNYVNHVNDTIAKLSAIIKRKAFLERRIHRFIDGHKGLLLPRYKACFYEHKIFTDDSFRKADYILERETGVPALLIELENPTHKVVTRNGDFTSEVNHAKGQVSEWVELINADPIRNASDELEFLRGPKDRLVIIGRGLEHADKLRKSVNDDTTVWTYDIFIDEAKVRLNNDYVTACNVIGLPESRPF